jgi:hypothetical protein
MRKELTLMARTKYFIRQSTKLLSDSEKLIAEWQKLIDDQKAKTVQRISARLKQKGPRSRN